MGPGDGVHVLILLWQVCHWLVVFLSILPINLPSSQLAYISLFSSRSPRNGGWLVCRCPFPPTMHIPSESLWRANCIGAGVSSRALIWYHRTIVLSRYPSWTIPFHRFILTLSKFDCEVSCAESCVWLLGPQLVVLLWEVVKLFRMRGCWTFKEWGPDWVGHWGKLMGQSLGRILGWVLLSASWSQGTVTSSYHTGP